MIQAILEKNKFKIENTFLPISKKNEVVINIRSSAICGTDVKKFVNGNSRVKILGHEFSGDIVINGIKKRVTVYTIYGCTKCDYCRIGKPIFCKNKIALGSDINGGFTENISVHLNNIFEFPDDIDYSLGSLLFDTVGTAYSTIIKFSSIKNKKILIFGLGPMGLSTGIIANYFGAYTIGVDAIKYRIKLANSLGFREVHLIKSINSLTKNNYDFCVDFTGKKEVIDMAVQLLKPCGELGIPGSISNNEIIFNNNLIRKEIKVFGTWYCSSQNFQDYLSILRNNYELYSKMITHKFSLNDIQKAFELATKSKEHGKIILIS